MSPISLIVLSLLAQAESHPTSPETKVQAQALLKEGAELYRQGAFADAVEKFDQAYAVFPSPKLLFNIGQASRELGRPVESVEAFDRFLVQAPDSPPELIAEAKQSVAELSRKIGKLLIDCTISGAEITVDGRKVGQTPLADLIRVAPGRHQVTATHAGAVPAIENVTVAAGTVETLVLRPRALIEVPAPTPAELALPVPSPSLDLQAPRASAEAAIDQGWWLGRKWTWVAAGSAVVFTGVAAVAGWSMQSKFDDLKQTCGKGAGGSGTGCASSDYSALDARKNTANVFWGLSAAAAVTAGVLFFVEGRPVTVAPLAGETTGLLAKTEF
jgi:hypothetical protein